MKKLILLSAIVFGLVPILAAQNTNPWPSSGSIGIGTTSPLHSLDVRGNIYTNASVYIDGGDLILKRITYPYGYVVRPNLPGYKKLQFAVEGGGPLEDLYVNADRSYFTGNVGIGTASPGTKLHVEGQIVAANSTNGFVQLWSDNALIWKNGNVNGRLRFGSAIDFNATGWSEKMCITDAGNVGIGISNPAAPLTVNTNSHLVAQFKANTTSNSMISVANNTGQINLGIGSATPHPYVWSNTGNLFIGADGSPTMFINGMANGSVGIGTTIPGPYKLAVEGTLGARKIKVTQVNPWADYVFDSSYRLPSLAEVEQFIQKNKHLSDVPSAKEVERNGLDLGDNQATLLKKIEEITLYLIQKDKEVELLNKKTAMQEQLIKELQTRLTNLEKRNTN